MTLLSASQLQTLRTRPQQTQLHLSIFEPSIILSCKVNGAITKGTQTIPYNSVTSGSYTNVQADMTLLVGSTPGNYDKGRVRVKSATAANILIAENSQIEWSETPLYLTIIKYWELWPVFPRIISDPSNSENVIFYKDYDIAYSNQNSVLGTFVCSGPHRAKYLDGGSVQIYYSSTGTFNPILSSLGHYWEFEGGTPSTFAGPTPGNVSYATPGHYVTKHIVTGSNGCYDISYRYVSIYDRPTVSSSTTIQEFGVGSIDGSRDSGGYTTNITINQPITSKLIPGMVVVLFSENTYNGIAASIGGNNSNNSDIFLVGHILEDTIKYDYETSSVEFVIGSITELMKACQGFSVSVEDSLSPSTWYQLLNMDSQRAVYHYLRWHSTALTLADLTFFGDFYPIQYFDADRGSLYDAINNFLNSTIPGELVADRQGGMFAEELAHAKPSIISPTIMTATKNDWMGEPNIKEQVDEVLSYLEYGGIAYSGKTTGTYAALMACAPGNAPAYHGTLERSQGLALLGQSALNTLVANVYANKNAEFPHIEMDMAGTFYNLDIAPQQQIQMNILASDTDRNKLITGTYTPQSISYQFDGNNLFLYPKVIYRRVLQPSLTGDTIAIPNIPNNGGYGQPPINIPNITPPIFPFGTPSNADYAIYYCNSVAGSAAVYLPWTLGFQKSSFSMTTGSFIATDETYVNILRTGVYQASVWGNAGRITLNLADKPFFTFTYPNKSPLIGFYDGDIVNLSGHTTNFAVSVLFYLDTISIPPQNLRCLISNFTGIISPSATLSIVRLGDV